ESYCAVGGLGTAAIPDTLETYLVGHLSTVAWLDVIERPFDNDPAQFSKLIVQLGLELMAGLGSQLRLSESDDEATDLGDHRNQANGQREQRGGEVSCQEERGRRSMIHWASFPGK